LRTAIELLTQLILLLHFVRPLPSTFRSWRLLHSKSYPNSAETAKRFSIFSANVAKINSHNAAAAKGVYTYTKALNQFADLTYEEWRQQVTGSTSHAERKSRMQERLTEHMSQLKSQSIPPSDAKSAFPTSLDWRTRNAVTEIKNQIGCNSAYAFSAVASMEGAHAIANKTLVSLSEQQLSQ
jgi:C1A family cysteine protease